MFDEGERPHNRPSKPSGWRTRATLSVGTLNMRGAGTSTRNGIGEKWLGINQVVRDNSVALLGIQETHLTDEKRDEINDLFKLTMKVYSTQDPANPTGARGVAIAINKRLINADETTCETVIPGRALMATIKWTRGEKFEVLVIYAPNDTTENEAFWEELQEELRRRRLPHPDILMGDFNIVESPLDRLPTRPDAEGPVDALQRMCQRMQLVDEWRMRHPQDRHFSYYQSATGSQSRIDRIYLNPRMRANATEWSTVGPGFPTDHQLTTCKLANREKPFIGKGRWRMHGILFADTEFMKQVKTRGLKLQQNLAGLGPRTQLNNPQTEYAKFKADVRELATKRAKEKIPRIDRKLEALRRDLDELNNAQPTRGDDDEENNARIGILRAEIAELEMKRFGHKRAAVAARDWLEGETISKYWMRLNKTNRQDETIYELERIGTTPVTYARRSDEMADIARSHYDSVQKDDSIPRPEVHHEAIEAAIRPVETRLTEEQKTTMAADIQYTEVVLAIQEAATGKAPGLDGIPSELWKELLIMHKKDTVKKRPAFDVAKILRDVFNDISNHGVAPGTTFAEGWICPIYKKSDKRRVSNYRPITLLNADYKVFTKILANRLAEVAADLIHPDQAGFVPGRKIHHQTKLTKMVIDYCEAEEINGVIIALDQEKAYDKINHEYLWKVLKHFNFPDSFINTIKALYAGATSVVSVNGVLSRMFEIIRGMRQGDPMSCILFDLAIEPLAVALRKSSLRGLELPGAAERLITSLFADDTTTFLHESDSYADLKTILAEWCTAARAKFNIPKTEVIPVGTIEYRERVRETRRLTPGDEPIDADIRIVPEGVAVRSLGAWIGNNIDDATPWEPILATIRENLERWSRRKPTMRGKKLVIGLEVGSRTQYLTRVQTMPRTVENKLIKMTREFIWDGNKHPPINLDTLCKPIEQGGIGLLDLKARNEAIDLMWAKEYLQLSPSRPKWAHIADALLARATNAASKTTDEIARVNPFLQTWGVSTHHKKKLPNDLSRMIKTAEKHAVRAAVRNPDEKVKALMPGWYHIGNQPGRYVANSAAGKCLREVYNVATVEDAINVAARLTRRAQPTTPAHRANQSCECYDCERDRVSKGCTNPHRCALAAQRVVERLHLIWKPEDNRQSDGLTLRTSGKRRNAEARKNREDITFNPSVAERTSLEMIFRVFEPSDEGELTQPVRRPRRGFEIAHEAVTAYTDGSAMEGGDKGPRAGCGIYCGQNNPLTHAVRLPMSIPQTNQAAEVYAVSVIATKAPPFAPLRIISDSAYMIDGLTRDLPIWEEKGWIGVENAQLFKDAAARLRARSARTYFRWVKGHSGVPGNEAADELAKTGAEMDPDEAYELPPPQAKFLARGASVLAMTQNLAYRGIRNATEKSARNATKIMIDRVSTTLEDLTKARVPEATIWQSLRHKDIARKTGDFLWRALHDSLRIGKYWRHINGYEAREMCVHCHTEESMEHILVECEAKATKVIRELVKKIIAKRTGETPALTLGEMIGASAVSYATRSDEDVRALDRFYRIVVTESTYMIWK